MNIKKHLKEKFFTTTKLASGIIWVTSSIKTWALVWDTSFEIKNILDLTKTGTIEWLETIRNFICNSVNEIVNFSDYLRENYDIPFPERKDESLIDIENIKLDFLQLKENLSDVDLTPEKIENLLTILVSMGSVSVIFMYLIPKILNKIEQKIN